MEAQFQVLRFGNEKSDEEIVYGSSYPFARNIETLIMNSTETRSAKKNRKKKLIGSPPRPQNSWIIYRRDTSAKPEFKGKTPQFISAEIEKLWKNESKEVKELFKALSRLALKKHIENPSNFGSPSFMEMDFESPLLSDVNLESPLTTDCNPQELDSPFPTDFNSQSSYLSADIPFDFVLNSPYEDPQLMIDVSPQTFGYEYSYSLNDMNMMGAANFAPLNSIAQNIIPYGYVPEDNVLPLDPTNYDNTTFPPPQPDISQLISQLSDEECALLLEYLKSDGHIISEEISPNQFDFNLLIPHSIFFDLQDSRSLQ
ncbi:16245_t:CDS:2 [Funneliformis mosseae]|uniref:16245_t:CDS:1 n=1 Tax=Funneliformis mosseae TaxID=27381 RepID=A0A9N9F3L3_FUNMO|nr:16245_t:CDS:2 [Funneliformis mosseae]